MSDLTKIANTLLDLAHELNHHRAEQHSAGLGWQAERNTLVGRIEVLEQSLAAAGVVDPNSTNPMAVAMYATAVKAFGNDGHRAAYLRARGWKWRVANHFGMWDHDTHGAWNGNTAISVQVGKDIEPLRKMLSEPDPLPKAVESPVYVDESTTQATVQLPPFHTKPIGPTGTAENWITCQAPPMNETYRDKNTGEVLIAPIQHHPV